MIVNDGYFDDYNTLLLLLLLLLLNECHVFKRAFKSRSLRFCPVWHLIQMMLRDAVLVPSFLRLLLLRQWRKWGFNKTTLILNFTPLSILLLIAKYRNFNVSGKCKTDDSQSGKSIYEFETTLQMSIA